jgi:hypothetical protein
MWSDLKDTLWFSTEDDSPAWLLVHGAAGRWRVELLAYGSPSWALLSFTPFQCVCGLIWRNDIFQELLVMLKWFWATKNYIHCQLENNIR